MSNTLSLAFTANFSATVFTDAGTVDFTNAILSVDTDGNSAAGKAEVQASRRRTHAESGAGCYAWAGHTPSHNCLGEPQSPGSSWPE